MSLNNVGVATYQEAADFMMGSREQNKATLKAILKRGFDQTWQALSEIRRLNGDLSCKVAPQKITDAGEEIILGHYAVRTGFQHETTVAEFYIREFSNGDYALYMPKQGDYKGTIMMPFSEKGAAYELYAAAAAHGLAVGQKGEDVLGKEKLSALHIAAAARPARNAFTANLG